MRKIILTIIVTLTLTLNVIFAQQSSSARYMPLAVGNKWVYWVYAEPSFCCKQSFSVVSDTMVNGKRYFKTSLKLPIFQIYELNIRFYRVDTITGNFLGLMSSGGCSYLMNEVLIDSLASNLNNISSNCPLSSQRILTDISNFVTPWNVSYPRKRFQYYNGADQSPTGYLQDLGLFGSATGPVGNIAYNITGCYINGVLHGDTTLTSINQLSSKVPTVYSLSQNYPNPFNPITKIRFDIPTKLLGQTFLSVYDIAGREIQTLVNEQLQPGTYEVTFDGSQLPSGVYFYQLRTGNFVDTKKLVLLK